MKELRFNRTFMELKQRNQLTLPINNDNVLIVPLWNWNLYWIESPPTVYCFNRTFMELKPYFKFYIWSS